jgi:hypothetical protein
MSLCSVLAANIIVLSEDPSSEESSVLSDSSLCSVLEGLIKAGLAASMALVSKSAVDKEENCCAREVGMVTVGMVCWLNGFEVVSSVSAADFMVEKNADRAPGQSAPK